MQLEQATRKETKMRLALLGLSGTGKTYSALLLAYGLCGDWSKIAVIDTEAQSASLYSHFGPFSTLQLEPPYHPSRYFEALCLCQNSNKEVIIIDSLSPEWAGEGGVLEGSNSCDYQELFRAHRLLFSQISRSTSHIICTVRTKRRIVCEDLGAKRHPWLVQLPVQQEGVEYPFTTVLQLDSKHRAHVVKDRSGVLTDKEPFVIEPKAGGWLGRWCKVEPRISPVFQQKVDACHSVTEHPNAETIPAPQSVVLIGPRGRMVKLHCPFIAFCIQNVGFLSKYTFVIVQAIRVTETARLVYVIGEQAYYHTHFRILIDLY